MVNPTYQVKDWPRLFEGAKSKSYKNKSSCQMPTKHGIGYRRLVRSKKGDAMFGAWCAMVQVLSRHMPPRTGFLTHDGTETGEPYSPDDLELLTDISAPVFAVMLKTCSSQPVGWLDVMKAKDTTRIPQGYHTDTTVSPQYPLDSDLDLDSDPDSNPSGIPEVIPDTSPLFDSPEMMAAWMTWKKHRGELKKKLTPTQIEKAVKKLKAWGERRAIAAIDFSVANGWQGLFEEDSKGGKQNTSGYVRHDQPNNPDRSAF